MCPSKTSLAVFPTKETKQILKSHENNLELFTHLFKSKISYALQSSSQTYSKTLEKVHDINFLINQMSPFFKHEEL